VLDGPLPRLHLRRAPHAAADIEEDAEADGALVAGLELDDLPQPTALEDLEVLAAEIVDGAAARVANHGRYRDDVHRSAEGRRLRHRDGHRRGLDADGCGQCRRCAHPRKPCVTSSHGASLLQQSCQLPQTAAFARLIGFRPKRTSLGASPGNPKW
jgi:hypothetical protein